jgi:hypothetical protein
MTTAMRVAGDKEGEGSKAMTMATRVAGEWTGMATKRAVLTATREACKEEGNGKGDTSNGDSKLCWQTGKARKK